MVYCRTPSQRWHVCSAFFWACACTQWGVGFGRRRRFLRISEDISLLEKYAAAVHTLSETPHNLTSRRTPLHNAKVADVVNQFSQPLTVIASYKSHHIAWNGRISSSALLQCVFKILPNESPPPSVPELLIAQKTSCPTCLSFLCVLLHSQGEIRTSNTEKERKRVNL